MTEFKRILCPIDFSDTSIRALTWAAAFAAGPESQLTVLHVTAPPLVAIEPGGFGGVGAVRARPSDETLVADARRAVAAAGLADANIVIEYGSAADVILKCATETGADLLAIGTHGAGGVRRLLLGSITEKVVRAAPSPVLTVPALADGATDRPPTFQHILCPVDHSPSSLKALDVAIDLARPTGGTVTALYALEYLDPEEPCEHVEPDIRWNRDHFVEHARERLHTHVDRARQPGCDVQEVVAIGRAYKEILKRASSLSTDLIVMGAQGHEGLELMLYGSNTQHVVRAAPCPVLTVRA